MGSLGSSPSAGGTAGWSSDSAAGTDMSTGSSLTSGFSGGWGSGTVSPYLRLCGRTPPRCTYGAHQGPPPRLRHRAPPRPSLRASNRPPTREPRRRVLSAPLLRQEGRQAGPLTARLARTCPPAHRRRSALPAAGTRPRERTRRMPSRCTGRAHPGLPPRLRHRAPPRVSKRPPTRKTRRRHRSPPRASNRLPTRKTRRRVLPAPALRREGRPAGPLT